MYFKAILFYSLFLLISGFAQPVDSQFFELKKVAVSSLPDDLLIPDLKSVTPDSNGNVFAFAGRSNIQGCFIVKFDGNLKFLKQFGRDGKGPGEFTTHLFSTDNRISVDIKGDVFIYDANPSRLVVFDNDGNYKRDIMVARDYSNSIPKLYRIKVVGEGIYVAFQARGELPPHGLLFTLAPPKILVCYPFTEERTYFENYSGDSFGENCFIDTDSRHVVFGNSQIFKFQVYDRAGNLITEVYDKKRAMGRHNDGEMKAIVDGTFTPKSGNSEFKNSLLAQLNAKKSDFQKMLDWIKKHKNVIADIKISGERIYVFPVREDITVMDRHPVEVYKLKGQLLKKGYFRQKPEKVWKNYAFYYDVDDEDNPLILKYEILEENFK
jgi:hypothetical protein